MKKVLILLLAILAIALVVYFCVYGKSIPNIEKDLSFRAQDKLNNNNMEWAKVNVDGRDITLTGTAPSMAQRNAAQRTATVEGVNFIDNQLIVSDQLANVLSSRLSEQEINATTTDKADANTATNTTTNTNTTEDSYSLIVAKDQDGKLVLKGVMSADMHQQVMQQATAKVGAEQLIDRISDQEVESPKELPTIAQAMLMRVAALDDGQARLAGKKLQISGSSPTEEAIQQVKQQTVNGLPEGFESSFNLMPPTAVANLSNASNASDTQNSVPPSSVTTAGQPIEQQIAQTSSATCQQKFNEILTRSKIYFNSSSTVIKKSSYKTLSQLATTANQCTTLTIKIHGHTDATGEKRLNQQLSKQRAQAVARYLAKKGVDPKHIRAVGHGSSKPIASNKTSEGRARNRRIELTVED